MIRRRRDDSGEHKNQQQRKEAVKSRHADGFHRMRFPRHQSRDANHTADSVRRKKIARIDERQCISKQQNLNPNEKTSRPNFPEQMRFAAPPFPAKHDEKSQDQTTLREPGKNRSEERRV